VRAAAEAFAERKFGAGGPFHPDTPDPWKESARVRSSAQKIRGEEFKECVAIMAQHIHERFGKFLSTVPSIFILTYLQAHHLDLEFYDHHFGPGRACEPTQSTCLAGIQKGARGKGTKSSEARREEEGRGQTDSRSRRHVAVTALSRNTVQRSR
jgi:hypothetical protein